MLEQALIIERVPDAALTSASERRVERDVRLAETLALFGALRRRQGRAREAEVHYREALEVYETVTGLHHPKAIETTRNLAIAIFHDDREDEAREEIDRVLAMANSNLLSPAELARLHLVAFDWEVPDWVLVPGGNLGNISAIAKGFAEMLELGLIDRLPRMVCCQAQRANPLYRAQQRADAAGRPLREEDFQAVRAEATLASAIQIGNPVSLPKAVRALVQTRGLVEHASEEELADAVARADRTGMFNCPHTGVALACLEKLVARGVIGKRERVVVISTAHGLKFTEFKTRYHEDALDFPATHANRPVPMGSDPKEVVDALHRLLDRRANT